VDYPFGLTDDQVKALIAQVYADRPRLISDFGRMFFASDVSEELRAWFNGLGLEASGHATAMIAESWRVEDLRGDLPLIHVPTGVFHGVLDKVIPFPSAMVTQQSIAGAELFPFEQGGHGAFYDELERFNRALVTFLSRPQ
jgi:non-heme chloroperoxidase